MMHNDDKKLLFPAYSLMHVGLGEDYVEYLLSGVLGTHGYTIRRIQIEAGGLLQVFCRCDREEQKGHGILIIHPLDEVKVSFHSGIHWSDLRLRYHLKEGNLSDPVWTQAFAYGNGMKGCRIVSIIDLVGMKYSEM